MDKDRRRRDVIRMKAGKVRKKVLALLLAGTAILGLTGGGNNAGGSSWAGKCLCGYKQL